jgi:hypothetical protein
MNNCIVEPQGWLVAFLLFQIGIPAVGLQVMPLEYRHFITKRPQILFIAVILPLFFSLLLAICGWLCSYYVDPLPGCMREALLSDIGARLWIVRISALLSTFVIPLVLFGFIGRAALQQQKLICFEGTLILNIVVGLVILSFPQSVFASNEPFVKMFVHPINSQDIWSGIFAWQVGIAIYTGLMASTILSRHQAIVKILEDQALSRKFELIRLFLIPLRAKLSSYSVRQVETHVCKTEQINKQGLMDLIELGRDSKTGQDEQVVLMAFERLVIGVTNFTRHGKVSYNGDQLRPLFEGLQDVISSSSTVSDFDNFETCLRIIKRVVDSYRVNAGQDLPKSSRDLQNAIRTLGILGKCALKQLHSRDNMTATLTQCHEIIRLAADTIVMRSATNSHQGESEKLTIWCSDSLLSIGITAVGDTQNLFSMGARAIDTLSAMKPVLVAASDGHEATLHNYLGLSARICSTGFTARERVKHELDMLSKHQNWPKFIPSRTVDDQKLTQLLGEAKFFFQNHDQHFTTANHVESMRRWVQSGYKHYTPPRELQAEY